MWPTKKHQNRAIGHFSVLEKITGLVQVFNRMSNSAYIRLKITNGSG